jgi:NAD(P)-dependent dehydrogenase (short-subunit alcohol dehydrogenase family)
MAGIDQRSIFITGAASGMGRATALRFGGEGWFVGAFDVNDEGLGSLAADLGERCFTRHLDVTDKRAYDAVVGEFAEQTGGRLDLLFNNAGIGHAGWFEDVPYEASMQIVQVNFVGVVNGIYAALPLLEVTDNSLCFSTSSSSATFGMPKLAMYSATKHAVKGLTEALSVEFSRLGVRVADALPGLIDTPILDATDHSDPDRDTGFIRSQAMAEGPFRLLPPEAVADCVWDSYHDETGRLHWYVPEEIADIDRQKAAGAEGVRDMLQMLLEGGVLG